MPSIIDVGSRCLLGWALDTSMTVELVQKAFERALDTAVIDASPVPFSTQIKAASTALTPSNLLVIFEHLIKDNLPGFLKDILQAGQIYSQLILSAEERTVFTKDLTNLSRIQGAPFYLLLLFLLKEREKLNLSDATLLSTIQLLTRFFVRRNITDTPNTRDLNKLFMDIISKIEEQKLSGTAIYQLIYCEIQKWSASDELFKEKLSGNIYEENVGVARYVLCDLAQRDMTTETWTDLWAQNEYNSKKVFKWTIEHIVPEGKKIPACWVDMIANGDRDLANRYLEQYVHKIGNLTITGYNSSLSNLSFIEKRDRTNKDKRYTATRTIWKSIKNWQKKILGQLKTLKTEPKRSSIN